MGERAVRSMAYSISASIEFSVPSTICSTIGSTDTASRSGAVGQGWLLWWMFIGPPPASASRAESQEYHADRPRHIDRGIPRSSSRTPPRRRVHRPDRPMAAMYGHTPAYPKTACRNKPHGWIWNGIARAPSKLRHSRSLDHAKAGNAEIDQLDLLPAGIVIAEGFEMRGIEGADQSRQKRLVYRTAGRRHPHLHRLPGIANVGFADQANARGFDAVPLQCRGGLAFQRGIARGDVVKVDGVFVHHLGDDVVGPPVHREQAECREVARVWRHDAGLHAQEIHHMRRLRRPGTAE